MANSGPSSFHSFSKLPSELQNYIWEKSSQSTGGSRIFLYKRGCWQPRWASYPDPDSQPTHIPFPKFEFRYDFLTHEFEIPLLMVSRNARSLVLAWIQHQDLKLCTSKEVELGQPGSHVVRTFNPIHDVLYVPLDKWNDFLRESNERLMEPDLITQILDVKMEVTHIALPEEVLRNPETRARVPQVFQLVLKMEVLLIIVNTQSDPDPSNEPKNMSRWAEFEGSRKGSFFWDAERRKFEFRGLKYDNEEVYELLEESLEEFEVEAARYRLRNLEVRPAFVTRSE